MALSGNQLYPQGKKHLLQKNIDVTDTSGVNQLKAALINNTYTAQVSDEFFNSISAKQIGSSVALANTAISVSGAGVVSIDADDVVLLAYFDNDGSAINLSTNGGDITVSFNASGIFKL
jgi:hypothetical protein